MRKEVEREREREREREKDEVRHMFNGETNEQLKVIITEKVNS